ncbi:MAG: DUF454 family protein [Gammaproteobacteria bacterium]|nr:DUF454 family protein [Gammaproteobacteria bacterium]
MKKRAGAAKPSGSIVASLLVLACVAIGVVGLVLPIIPGLIFLALAAVIAARHFPWVGARLRNHRSLGRHLNRADGFVRLSLPDKIRVAGLLCAKALLDGAACVASLLRKPGRRVRS